MNILMLVAGGILYVLIVYQIWIGKAPDPFPSQYAPQRSVSRKTQPVAFWLAIALQIILATVVVYFSFRV
ncbi:MAG: hypothetical protein EPO32_07430 [Anaerolineae bacterium]|nr:MAG: hypothetical protein EPO32_07430 [Anaerolineae bacterium]